MQTTQTAIFLLNQIKKADINYGLIRNYDCLIKRHKFNEKDIDLLIQQKDKRKVFEIMQKFGFKKLLICPSAGHYGFVKYVDGRFLSFHIHAGGISGSSIPYLAAEPLLSRKKKKKDLYILSQEDQLLALILHSYLDSCTFKKKYKQQIKQLQRKKLDFEYIQQKLLEVSSGAFSKKIIEYLTRRKYRKLENLRLKFRKQFYHGSKKRILGLLKSNILRYLWTAWRLTRNAPLVSLIGMDGAGKTTLTNALKKRFDNSLITCSLLYTGRGRNNLLPIQFLGRKYKKIENKIEKSAFRNKNKTDAQIIKKIIYILSAPIFGFDLLLRCWFIIRPKRKIKQIVITDRYSTDILLMAYVPMPFKQIIYSFFPKPTLTIYVYDAAKILHLRKPDHSLADLKRQQNIFREINKTISPFSIKNNNIQKALDCISKECWKLF